MNQEYWKLFWTTGMPEAWLMSRGNERIPATEASPDGIQSLSSPLVDSPLPVSANVPGSPRNPY